MTEQGPQPMSKMHMLYVAVNVPSAGSRYSLACGSAPRRVHVIVAGCCVRLELKHRRQRRVYCCGGGRRLGRRPDEAHRLGVLQDDAVTRPVSCLCLHQDLHCHSTDFLAIV
jgi:hypothetical protein